MIPKLHQLPTASRQLEFGDRHIASVSGVSGGQRSRPSVRVCFVRISAQPTNALPTRLLLHHHAVLARASRAGETGGLGDRSRNLSADTIAVEIDLVRLPFQVLLPTYPINPAFSYLSSGQSVLEGSRVAHLHTSFGCHTDLLPGGYSLQQLAYGFVLRDIARHCASAYAGPTKRF
jgi:hypothetical protein